MNGYFDKYVWISPIPEFDPLDPAHAALVRLSEQAETVARDVTVTGLGFQRGRAAIRAALQEAGVSTELDRTVQDLLRAGSL